MDEGSKISSLILGSLHCSTLLLLLLLLESPGGQKGGFVISFPRKKLVRINISSKAGKGQGRSRNNYMTKLLERKRKDGGGRRPQQLEFAQLRASQPQCRSSKVLCFAVEENDVCPCLPAFHHSNALTFSPRLMPVALSYFLILTHTYSGARAAASASLPAAPEIQRHRPNLISAQLSFLC